MGRRYRASRWIGTALAITGLAALPAGAHAEPVKKTFTAKAPASALPTTKQFLQFTITNDKTSNAKLGSANVTVPTGFEVEAASTDRGTLDSAQTDKTIKLRNLNLDPNNTVTLKVTALTPPCGTTQHLWAVLVKQANDFNGTGNNFSASTGTSLTTVINCPQSDGQSKKTECKAEEDCTVTITYSSSPAMELTAIALANGRAGELSARWFDRLVEPVGDTEFDCAGQPYDPPRSGLVLFNDGTPITGRNKALTLRLSPTVVGNTPTDALEVCAAVPAATPCVFKEVEGAFLFDGDGDRLPEPWVFGLLADCVPGAMQFQAARPCIQKRYFDTAGNATIEFDVPELPADPPYH